MFVLYISTETHPGIICLVDSLLMLALKKKKKSLYHPVCKSEHFPCHLYC